MSLPAAPRTPQRTAVSSPAVRLPLHAAQPTDHRHADHPARRTCLRGIAAARGHRGAAPAARRRRGAAHRAPQPDAGHDPHRGRSSRACSARPAARSSSCSRCRRPSGRPRGHGALCALERDVAAAPARRPDRHRRTARASSLRGRHLLARARARSATGPQAMSAARSTSAGRPSLRSTGSTAVRTRMLPRKLSGVFQQQVMAAKRPIDGRAGMQPFACPVSRHAEVQRSRRAVAARPRRAWRSRRESGLCLIADEPRRALYMFNHLEYDADTLEARVRARPRATRGRFRAPRTICRTTTYRSRPPPAVAPAGREALRQLAGDPRSAPARRPGRGPRALGGVTIRGLPLGQAQAMDAGAQSWP